MHPLLYVALAKLWVIKWTLFIVTYTKRQKNILDVYLRCVNMTRVIIVVDFYKKISLFIGTIQDNTSFNIYT